MKPTINYCSNCLYFESGSKCSICSQFLISEEPSHYMPKSMVYINTKRNNSNAMLKTSGTGIDCRMLNSER